MVGKLIVIEGIDGSGKSTQLDLLKAKLGQAGELFRYQRFPRYDDPSSILVRMYLGGEFGNDPCATNPYTASAYFAVDRAAAFAGELGSFYRSGGTVLCDRYTTSNAIYQAAKMKADELEEFAQWLFDFEYNRMGLPRPDAVIFLDVPEEITLRLRTERGNAPDIHEADQVFLHNSAETARFMANKYGWKRIECTLNGKLRTPEDISEEIFYIVNSLKNFER